MFSDSSSHPQPITDVKSEDQTLFSYLARVTRADDLISLMVNGDLKENVLRIINERNRRDEEQEFNDWCDYLLSLPAGLEFMPKGNFKADIELQPLRWTSLGIDLIQSSKVTARVELAGGVQGPPMSSYLPYPVFQIGAEIFLKGIWLCQFPECRALTHSSYIDSDKRQKYLKKLGSNGLSHDLLKVIDEVRRIPEYWRRPSIMRFLKLVERIVRRYYFPPYDADKRTRWADTRYPKRVYEDVVHVSSAEGLTSYPQARWIETLFRQMEEDVDHLWQLRAEVSARTKSRRAK